MGSTGALHGHWCGTRVWPTRCWDCNARAWFFTCRCGSKVLFDELGWPWAQHDCDRSWERSRLRHTDANGNLITEIADDVRLVRPADFDIELRPTAAHPRGTLSWSHPIVPMYPPPGASDEITRVVRELIPNVDPHRRLGIPRTSVGRAALGVLGGQPLGQITVHTPSPEEDDLLESFTAYAPQVLLDGLKRDISVTVRLEAVDVLGADCVWFCSRLTVH